VTASALPELELLDVSALEPERGVEVETGADRRGWWPVVVAAGVAAALVVSGRNGPAPERAAPAMRPPPVATTAAATPPESFSIVMTDSLSRRMVMVDPRGRAVRLAITADPVMHPLDVAAPSPLDVSLGGLPQGRRPVAVLDKSIVLVPATTAGPPVELWGGGVNLHVLDGVGRFVAASDDRVATVDRSCASCTLRISSSGGQLVREIAPFTGFQPVSTGSFSPDDRYVAVRFAEEHRPFDGVAIADVAAGTIEPLLGVGGDDALAMAWSPDSTLYLLGPVDVLRYQPGAGITGRIPIVDWQGAT